MDCVAVLQDDGSIIVKEFRNIRSGDKVACGRHENGEDGIFVHTGAFDFMDSANEKFAFRSRITRETSFSIDYDELYDLLEYERQLGFIVWVLGRPWSLTATRAAPLPAGRQGLRARTAGG
jgi:hypothetical protein